MPSFSKILAFGAGLAATTAALPHDAENMRFAPRSASTISVSAVSTSTSSSSSATATVDAANTRGEGGVTDFDILQFALTLENLEGTFYQQGFSKFQASDFSAAGLSQAEIDGLMATGSTESTHVQTLSGALQAAGQKPVQKCQYNFQAALANPKSMIATARVLEAVGVTAYLGAAPLINSSAILGVAASIATIESRHQTFLRLVSKADPIPNAFDSHLTVKQVFTLAAPFIKSCPTGSNLNIQANPAIALTTPMVKSGQQLVLQNNAMPDNASFCAFVGTGKAQYSQLKNGSCQVPSGLTGEVFMMVTSSMDVTDDAVIAGPSVILAS